MKQPGIIAPFFQKTTKVLAAVALIVFCLTSCTQLPDADSFAAPEMGEVEIVENGCFTMKLKCEVDFGPTAQSELEYGFYLQTCAINEENSSNGKSSTPSETEATGKLRSYPENIITVPATRSGNTITATAGNLSSGTYYLCTPFIKQGEYVALGQGTSITTEDPFKDANFKSYILSEFDTNGDGGISFKEALGADTITVVTDKIADLAGVELFTELRYLYCAGISQEEFKYNPGTEGYLTSLDVSKNTKLDFINCGHNKISKIDVSNNKFLRFFDCNNTLITSLDLTGNYYLEGLEGHDCQYLAEVKYATNGNLRSVFLHNCNLSGVDISMLHYIDSYNCGYSQHISTLDFSRNKFLTILGVPGLPLLEELDLSNCENITDVDCDQCHNLKTIYLHKNAQPNNLVIPESTKVVYAE